MVFNKIDRSGREPGLERDASGKAVAARVSAIDGQGIEALALAVTEHLSISRSAGWLAVPAAEGRLRAQLFSADAVLEERFGDNGVSHLKIDMDTAEFARIAREHRICATLDEEPPPLAAGGHC